MTALPPRSSPSLSLRILLLGAFSAAFWLVRPFADALLIASVVALLAWPLHARILRVPRMRDALATALTVLLLTVVAVGPAGGLVWLASRELVTLAMQLTGALDAGGLDGWGRSADQTALGEWVIDRAGGADAFAATLSAAVRDASMNVAASVGQLVPGLVGVTARVIVKFAIFYLALATLLHRGTELGAWVTRMSPLPPSQTARLFDVFSGLARNVVLAAVVTACVQGVVAGIGYRLAGVDRPILFALLTGVLSFVPLVGTLVGWGPVALLLFLNGRGGAALFVVAWSLALTGTVDNLIKPLIVRGNSHMPTLLVFLGVFGGLAWFGLTGVFAGPMIMAFLLTLLTFYDESTAAVAPVGEA